MGGLPRVGQVLVLGALVACGSTDVDRETGGVGGGGQEQGKVDQIQACDGQVGVVIAGSINLRSEPLVGIDDIVGELPLGTVLDVEETGIAGTDSVFTWTRVRHGEIPGYVASDLLRISCRPAEASLQAGLDVLVRPLVEQFPGDVAVAVLDLQDGSVFQIEGDRPHKTASSMKLFMAAAAIDRLSEDDAWFTWDTLDPHLTNVFSYSTNEPAEWLLYYAGDGSVQRGGERVNEMFREMGMNDSLVVAWDTSEWSGGAPGGFYYGGAFDDSAPVYANNRFTALDAVRGIRAIREGQVFQKELGWRLLEQLAAQNGFYYMRRHLPLDRIWVADKVGWITAEDFGPWHQATNDIGMVKLLDRTHPATGAPPAYALAVLVQSDVAEHTNPEAVALIAAISLAVYEYHDAKFAPVAPSVPAP